LTAGSPFVYIDFDRDLDTSFIIMCYFSTLAKVSESWNKKNRNNEV